MPGEESDCQCDIGPWWVIAGSISRRHAHTDGSCCSCCTESAAISQHLTGGGGGEHAGCGGREARQGIPAGGDSPADVSRGSGKTCLVGL